MSEKKPLTPIEFAEEYLTPYRVKGTEIIPTLCPVCHGGEAADANTFALNLLTGVWNCKRGSCSKEGNFQQLTDMFGVDGKLMETQNVSMSKKKTYDLPTTEVLPLTDEIIDYFERRKISKETLIANGVGADNNGNIVFPFYRKGVLTYVKIRKPRKPEKGERKEWQDKNTEPILFGMDNVAFNSQLIITEGMVDSLSLYEAGIHNVVSVPSGCDNLEWVNLCWDWLEKFNDILIFGDADEPGQKMVQKVIKMLGEARCSVIEEYPSRPNDPSVPCKDPNEILYFYGAEKLQEMISSAQKVKIRGIIQLSEIKRVDYTSVPRVLSKIPKFDELIGGFFDGTLTVVTGKSGEGKLLADETPVLTLKGWKTHGELVVNDYVMGAKGEWVRVEAIAPKYFANMVIKLSNGETFYCHENHEWPVFWTMEPGVLHPFSGSFIRGGLMTAKEIFESGQTYMPFYLYDKSTETISFDESDCHITSIGYCNHRQGNCIQVHGGLYRVGKTMTLTHNSTVNGTILLNAIEQGYNVFAYSGELSAPKFLDWTLLQAAGSDYITAKFDKYRNKMMPYVPRDVERSILKWTEGKFYLADNREIGSDAEGEGILHLCEQAARRYGCHMFLIDNAMTAIATSEDERLSQIKLAKDLKQFAVKYDAAIILVAHPRKLPPGVVSMNADDISGASELKNLADAIFAVEKPDIRLLKNREEGLNTLIQCAYCPDSRRVYQVNVGDNYEYSWDKSTVQKPTELARHLPEYNTVRMKMSDPV